MKIRMTKTVPVAIDGIHVRKFSKGWEGEIDPKIAKVLFSLDAAVIVRDQAVVPGTVSIVEPSERAVMLGAPEVKVGTGAKTRKIKR